MCGLASDRAAGKPVEVAADVLRAAAAAEGLDTSQPGLIAAAAHGSDRPDRGPGGHAARGRRSPDVDLPQHASASEQPWPEQDGILQRADLLRSCAVGAADRLDRGDIQPPTPVG